MEIDNLRKIITPRLVNNNIKFINKIRNIISAQNLQKSNKIPH